jgi:hypothetical protein
LALTAGACVPQTQLSFGVFAQFFDPHLNVFLLITLPFPQAFVRYIFACLSEGGGTILTEFIAFTI